MEISFDPVKRAHTLRTRGLDFADALRMFEGRTLTVIDDRQDYGGVRYVTYGWIEAAAVAMVWTERAGAMRVISMRRMHQREMVHVGLE